MLSTLISLYKLLGTGDFFKVLLILLKGLFARSEACKKITRLLHMKRVQQPCCFIRAGVLFKCRTGIRKAYRR